MTAPFRWGVQNSSSPSSASSLPTPPASSSCDSIHPGVQAKNFGVILDSISNPSTNSAGLTIKYIEDAITSDHLHCHHQLSPGILLWPTIWIPCFCWPHYSLFSAKWPQWSFQHRSGHSSVWNPLNNSPLVCPLKNISPWLFFKYSRHTPASSHLFTCGSHRLEGSFPTGPHDLLKGHLIKKCLTPSFFYLL